LALNKDIFWKGKKLEKVLIKDESGSEMFWPDPDQSKHCKFSHPTGSISMRLVQVAAACYADMLTMVETEKEQRRALLEGGVREAEREAFELLPEDERQCALCKTTCFMSALTIVNGREDQEIVCLRHFKNMEVDPANLILRYRYVVCLGLVHLERWFFSLGGFPFSFPSVC